MPNGDQQAQSGYQMQELVVALPYRELIRTKIAALGLTVKEPAPEERAEYESEELDLALLDLENINTQKVTDDLKAEVLRQAADKANTTDAGSVPLGDDPSNVDRLLYCLRRIIGRDNGGWFPDMGKNRDVETVAGQPHLSGTADEYPTPAQRPRNEVPQNWGAGIRVGILDTKLFAHPDLDKIEASDGTILTEAELTDPARTHFLGHGTFITGLVHRFAPAAELVVRWVLGKPRATATAWDVARAMVAFKGSGVHILCLAMGGYSRDGKRPLVLSRAVDVLSPDIVVLAAAGNRARRESEATEPASAAEAGPPTDIDKLPIWPGADTDVIAAGAVTSSGERADFSPKLPWVKLAALGTGVVSTFLFGEVEIDRSPRYANITRNFESGYARWSGTSAAVAIVAGRLAATASENGRDVPAAVKQLLAEAASAPLGPDEGGVFLPEPARNS
jgi:hypothetical protein